MVKLKKSMCLSTLDLWKCKMPPVSRLGDPGAGHGCFPTTNVIAGAGSVFVNGKPVARVSDALDAHAGSCPAGKHSRSIAAGSGNLFAEGLPVARIGDPIDCGGALAKGSPNVNNG